MLFLRNYVCLSGPEQGKDKMVNIIKKRFRQKIVLIDILIVPGKEKLAFGRSHKPHTFTLTIACACEAWNGPTNESLPIQ